MDIVEDNALNGEDQGNHKSHMPGSLYAPPYCEHQKVHQELMQKPNEVEKDV